MKINELTSNTVKKDDNNDIEFDGFSKKDKKVLPFKIDNFDVLLSGKDYNRILMVSVWHADKMIASLQLSKKELQIGIVYDILDASIRPSYQGKAIGLKLYKGLVNMGTTLGSFGSHSPGAKKLWARLGQNSDISLYGIEDKTKVYKVESTGDDLILNGNSIYNTDLDVLMTKRGGQTDLKLESIIK